MLPFNIFEKDRKKANATKTLCKQTRSQSRSLSVFKLTSAVFVTLLCIPLHADNESELQELTTPAGHKFWYYAMPKAERTSLAISWAQQVPVDDEIHPSTARLAIDLMLNGGAGGRDAAQIVADYEDLDSGSGLWVQPRDVSGFIEAPDQHLAKAREIAQQVITEPAFEQRWFDREHQKLVESAIEDQSKAWSSGWNLVHRILFDDHPYEKFWSLSPIDELKSIELSDVKKWHSESLSTAAITISVAGSSAPDTVAKEVDLLLAGLPSNQPSKPVDFPEPIVPGKTILLHKPDAPKTQVILLGNFPAHNQDTDVPLQLGVGVLGYGQQSRLFKSVRAGLGATYGFSAGVFNFTRAHRMFEMVGEIETAQLQTVLGEIDKTYTKFREKGIGPLEFPIAKRFYKRETTKQLKSPTSVAFTVSNALRNGFDKNYVHDLLDNIDGLARGDTNSLISASFPEYEQLLKVIVSPDDKALEGACVISDTDEVADCL